MENVGKGMSAGKKNGKKAIILVLRVRSRATQWCTYHKSTHKPAASPKLQHILNDGQRKGRGNRNLKLRKKSRKKLYKMKSAAHQ